MTQPAAPNRIFKRRPQLQQRNTFRSKIVTQIKQNENRKRLFKCSKLQGCVTVFETLERKKITELDLEGKNTNKSN